MLSVHLYRLPLWINLSIIKTVKLKKELGLTLIMYDSDTYNYDG